MPPSRAPPLSWSWTGSSGRAPAMEVASSAAAAVARAFRSRAAAVALARTRSAASASSFGTDGSFVLLCSCRALSSIALSCARLAASTLLGGTDTRPSFAPEEDICKGIDAGRRSAAVAVLEISPGSLAARGFPLLAFEMETSAPFLP